VAGTGTGRPRRPTRARNGPASGPTFTYGPIAYTRRWYGSGGARGSGGHGERPLCVGDATVSGNLCAHGEVDLAEMLQELIEVYALVTVEAGKF
jgi:hypothetical protein